MLTTQHSPARSSAEAGEGVTGNKVATADKHSTDYEQGGHENVAKKGEEAIKQGLNNVQGSTK
jgi:hypothetical protein